MAEKLSATKVAKDSSDYVSCKLWNDWSRKVLKKEIFFKIFITKILKSQNTNTYGPANVNLNVYSSVCVSSLCTFSLILMRFLGVRIYIRLGVRPMQ